MEETRKEIDMTALQSVDAAQYIWCRSDINSRAGHNGATALHRAAEFAVSPDVITALLKEGADVHARDRRGWSPLHWAAKSNRTLEVTKTLLKAGADAHAKDEKGYTPRHFAVVWNENPEVFKTLNAWSGKMTEELYTLGRERINAADEEDTPDFKELKVSSSSHEWTQYRGINVVKLPRTPELEAWGMPHVYVTEVSDGQIHTSMTGVWTVIGEFWKAWRNQDG